MKVITSLVTTGHHDIMEDVSSIENSIKLLATTESTNDEMIYFTEDVSYKPWGKHSGQ